MSLAKSTEQSGSKKVDDNKDVKVSAVKDRKITTITTNAIPAGGKLLMALIKETLLEVG